ncbi:MAG: hypothetical protein ACLGIR_04005 [Actinomycetes bacterium]
MRELVTWPLSVRRLVTSGCEPLDSTTLSGMEMNPHQVERGWDDLMVVALGNAPVCSAGLRAALESAAVPADGLAWLPVEVAGPAGEVRDHWMLRLPPLPVGAVDEGRSTMVRGSLDPMVRPVYVASALEGRRVVRWPSELSMEVVVTSEVREAVDAAGLSNIRWEPIAVV